MYRAFQHFDTDNSGTISQAELREALRVSTARAPLLGSACCLASSFQWIPAICHPHALRLVELSMTWITMMRAAKAAQA